MGIVIHTAPQTRGVIAIWAAEEVGIPYDKVLLDFKAGEHKSDAYAKVNPNRRVPAMVVDGRPMFELTAIVIFLAEAHGKQKKLWPEDAPSRAEAMGWTVWGTTQLGQDIHSLVMSSSERAPKEMHNEAQAKAAREAIQKDLTVLDERLAKHPYVMGDAFTLADVVPAGSVFFARMGGVDLSPYEHIGAWMQKIGTRPGLQRAQAT